MDVYLSTLQNMSKFVPNTLHTAFIIATNSTDYNFDNPVSFSVPMKHSARTFRLCSKMSLRAFSRATLFSGRFELNLVDSRGGKIT